MSNYTRSRIIAMVLIFSEAVLSPKSLIKFMIVRTGSPWIFLSNQYNPASAAEEAHTFFRGCAASRSLEILGERSWLRLRP